MVCYSLAHVRTVKLLLTTIAAVLLVGCGNPESALIEAAIEGNIEAVKQHLAAGADVNAKANQFGSTSLHFAAGGGHKEIVELLIDKGADVNAKTADDETPLDLAIQFREPEIAVLLRKHRGKKALEL